MQKNDLNIQNVITNINNAKWTKPGLKSTKTDKVGRRRIDQDIFKSHESHIESERISMHETTVPNASQKSNNLTNFNNN